MRISTVLFVLAVLIVALPVSADSLWPENHGSLFADNKAYKVGDIVTIVVNENAATSTAAGSTLSKTSSTDLSAETVIMPTGRTTTKKFFTEDAPAAKWNSERTFTGTGARTVNESVQTSIAAVVREVLPNGNLMIEGKRVRESVGERITVVISGIARAEDITTSNTIASTSLAQARIIVETAGSVARSTKRGWFDHFMDIIWPL